MEPETQHPSPQLDRSATGVRHPAHPLVRGVLQWLKAQAENSLEVPVCEWRGCKYELLLLKEGRHHDPSPGAIITPEDPDGFTPDLLNISEDAELSPEETDLAGLDRVVNFIDRCAWSDIEYKLRASVTPELYAQYGLKALNRELAKLEREVARTKAEGQGSAETEDPQPKEENNSTR